MAVVCSEVKEDYFLSTIGAVFDDEEEEQEDSELGQQLESGWLSVFSALWILNYRSGIYSLTINSRSGSYLTGHCGSGSYLPGHCRSESGFVSDFSVCFGSGSHSYIFVESAKDDPC